MIQAGRAADAGYLPKGDDPDGLSVLGATSQVELTYAIVFGQACTEQADPVESVGSRSPFALDWFTVFSAADSALASGATEVKNTVRPVAKLAAATMISLLIDIFMEPP